MFFFTFIETSKMLEDELDQELQEANSLLKKYEKENQKLTEEVEKLKNIKSSLTKSEKENDTLHQKIKTLEASLSKKQTNLRTVEIDFS